MTTRRRTGRRGPGGKPRAVLAVDFVEVVLGVRVSPREALGHVAAYRRKANRRAEAEGLGKRVGTSSAAIRREMIMWRRYNAYLKRLADRRDP